MASMCVVKKGDVDRHGFLDSEQDLFDLFTGDSDDFRVVSRLSLRAVRALLCLCSVWGALPCSLLRLFSRCAGRLHAHRVSPAGGAQLVVHASDHAIRMRPVAWQGPAYTGGTFR